MSQWNTPDELLDFAIKGEEEAAQFYRALAGRVDNPGLKKMFEANAVEEDGHKAKLERVKMSGSFAPAAMKVQDLKIGDYLVDLDPEKVDNYQDALIIGMKREKAAYKLYSDMARTTDDGELKNLLLLLAQEEAKHKLQFELEYDENILTDN
jgi:rubrerythrin